MKMGLSLAIILFISHLSFGQTDSLDIQINESGTLEGKTIVNFTNKPAPDLYALSKEWISYTFKSSEKVTQSEIENKMIRFNGISTSVIGPSMSFYFDLEYDIQLDFKDNKLRFRAYNLNQISQMSPYKKFSFTMLFKKSGKLKSGKVYLKQKSQIDTELTRLLTSLKNYIEGRPEEGLDDW